MKEVAYILFGAAFTVAVAVGLGSLLLRHLKVTLYREEAALFAFLSGSALLSLATFLLCVLQLAYKGVFLAAGTAVIVLAWHVGHALACPEITETTKAGEAKACPTRAWNLLFLVVLAGFFILYFFNALAPEISPDGSGYHLANVARFWRHHGFMWDYHNMYAYFPQGLEMLFLVAFVFGHFSAAALVHFAFFLSLPFLIACYGRRYGFPNVGLFAAILVYASPVAGKAGISAYNDLAVAAIVFAVFYLLQIWDEDRAPGLLILIGLLAGFAYSVKYTAALALPFAAGYLWWRTRGRGWPQTLAVFGSSAALMVVPWILRNWIWLGNPFSPLLNRWFPNPYYHPGMEQAYLADVRTYEALVHWWQIPWRHIVTGELVGGMIGPIFLLTPLALLALRRSSGRRLLLAGLIFGLPALLNAESRFLLPALPFVSIALGHALAGPRALLPILAVAHSLAGLPGVMNLYANPYSWRVESIPFAAALRLVQEPVFLVEHLTDYPLKYLLESKTPAESKILIWGDEPGAYINRTLIPWFESALGNLGFELLTTPLSQENQPSIALRLDFHPMAARRLRVAQTGSGIGRWTVAELHLFSRGRELAREPLWKLSAQPNPWDVGLAFDSNYASRWSSWQPMSAGMFLAIDFGKVETVDEIVCVMAPNQAAQIKVETAGEDRKWVSLQSTIRRDPFAVPSDLRREAIRSLKAHGVTHLVLREGDLPASDVRSHSDLWGLQELGVVGPLHLYRLE